MESTSVFITNVAADIIRSSKSNYYIKYSENRTNNLSEAASRRLKIKNGVCNLAI